MTSPKPPGRRKGAPEPAGTRETPSQQHSRILDELDALLRRARRDPTRADADPDAGAEALGEVGADRVVPPPVPPPAEGRTNAGAPASTLAAEAADAAEDLDRVLAALCLGGDARGRTSLMELLRALEWRRAAGPYFGIEQVTQALQALARQGRAVEAPGGVWSAEPAARAARLPALLRSRPASPLWHALAAVQGWRSVGAGASPRVRPRTPHEAAATLLALLAAGSSPDQYERAQPWHSSPISDAGVVRAALRDLIALGCSDLADPSLLWGLLGAAEGPLLLLRCLTSCCRCERRESGS